MRSGVDRPPSAWVPGTQTNWRHSRFSHAVTTAVTWDEVIELCFERVPQARAYEPYAPASAYTKLESMRERLHAFQGTDAERTAKILWRTARSFVFVRLHQNAVERFVPCANANFRNDWARPSKAERTKREQHFSRKWQHVPREDILPDDRWWSNGHVLCNVMPPDVQSDKHLLALRDMLQTVCNERGAPDCEFFVTPRDAPMVRRDGRAPNPFITHGPACRGATSLLPVFCFYGGPDYFDVPCPLASDWARAMRGRDFGGRAVAPSPRQLAWASKRPQAVWRGSLTGAGTDVATNPRMALLRKAAKSTLIDAAATSANAGRDKVHPISGQITSVNPSRWKTARENFVPFHVQQETFRYMLVLDGHSAPDRLGPALGGMQVVLRAQSHPWVHGPHTWLDAFLQPDVHYVQLLPDASDAEYHVSLLEQDTKTALKIACRARAFYLKHCTYTGILDWWQDALHCLPPACKNAHTTTENVPTLTTKTMPAGEL